MLILVVCPEYLGSFTILCLFHPAISVWFASNDQHLWTSLLRISLGFLSSFCTHKEQEVLGSLHHPGASHSPWLVAVRIFKLSPLGLRWDNSKAPQDQTETETLPEITPLADLPFHTLLKFIPYQLPWEHVLTNHLPMNLYLSDCFWGTLPKARSNCIIKRETA